MTGTQRPESVTDLRVGGFEPFSSLDYPGHLAAVVFCQGCPLRCLYCHNTDLLPVHREGLVSWRDVVTHLHTRMGLLDGVVFSGGEPLMQSSFPDAIDEVRKLGYSVALHTAGCTPRRLERVLDRLDWVGLDIKTLPDEYGHLTGIGAAGQKAWDSLKLTIDSGVDYEVRTTVWPRLHTRRAALEMAEQLTAAGVHHWILQETRDPLTRRAMGGAILQDTELLAELAMGFDTFEVRRAG
jgi:pyruvate formate lyase activating enzyme